MIYQTISLDGNIHVRIRNFKILGKNGDIACFYSVENLCPCHKLEVVKTFKDCHLEIKN